MQGKVILMRFKFVCTENAPQKRYFTKCLFSCFAKTVHFKYARHNRRRRSTMQQALLQTVYCFGEWVQRSSSTGYRIVTAARRSTVQQALLQAVYRCV